jgi:hypothetical protein
MATKQEEENLLTINVKSKFSLLVAIFDDKRFMATSNTHSCLREISLITHGSDTHTHGNNNNNNNYNTKTLFLWSAAVTDESRLEVESKSQDVDLPSYEMKSKQK